MKSSKLILAKKRLYATKIPKLIYIWLVFVPSLSACGASIGSSAIGTTEFMQQHNHKVSLMLRQSEEETPTARSWQK